MHSRTSSTDWRANLRWLTGIAFVVVAAAATLLFMLAGLARPEAGRQVIAGIMQVALLPEADSRLLARADTGFEPGQSFQLLAGLEVQLDPTELADFTEEQAENRIAGVMTDRLRTSGEAGVLELASDSQLLEQLRGAVDGPVRQLVTAQLGAALLGAGLADGSRLADWRTQAANNPGTPVQPIVGVFVTADAQLVESLTAAGIGELAVAGLAAAFVEGGEQAARELLANANLLALYDQAVAGPLASGLHGLFRALLLGFSGEIRERLAAAQEQQRATAEATAAESRLAQGLVQAVELEGLSVAQANSLVLSRLAERVHQDGPQALEQLLSDREQQRDAAEAAPLLRRFTGEAAAGYMRLAWILTVVAVLLGVVMIACSYGWGRLANPGSALVIAGLPGLLLIRWLQGGLETLGLTAGPGDSTGFLAGLWSDISQLLLSVPAGLLEAAQLPWLLVTAAGALLLLLALLLWLLPLVSPRRRYRL